MKTRTRFFTYALMSLLVATASPLHAQTVINAGAADLYDTQVLLINPGTLRFQDAQLAVGAHMLHYGFLDQHHAGLRNTYVSVMLPQVTKLQLGVGLVGTTFRTPIFADSKINLMFGFKAGENLGLGMQFGVLSKAFQEDNFVLIDEGDPVFANGTAKNTFNLGLGAFWRYRPELHFGFALENVNRPNISFIGEPVRQSRVFHFSAQYLFAGLEAGLGFYVDGRRFFPSASLTTSLQGLGILKLGVLAGNLDFGGQLHVNERISFDYKYSYALSPIAAYSNGSHRVSLVYRFGDLPTMNFEVTATVDQQHIVEKRLVKQRLDSLAQADIVKFDFTHKLLSANNPVDRYYSFVSVGAVTPLPTIDFLPFLKKYQVLVEFLGRELQANKRMTLRIIVPKESEKYVHLAQSFTAYFDSAYSIPAARIEYGYADFDTTAVIPANGRDRHRSQSLAHTLTHFLIRPHVSRKYQRLSGIRSWSLRIEDSRGHVVKRFHANGEPPASLTWDWKTDEGELIGVGKYRYYLQWWDRRNKEQRSKSKLIDVIRHVRETRVEFAKTVRYANDQHLRIDWLLGFEK